MVGNQYLGQIHLAGESALPDLFINTSDSATLSENLGLFEQISISASDTASTFESNLLGSQGGVTILDNLFISDVSALSGVPNPSVSDSIALSESRTVAITTEINKSDSLTLSEALSFNFLINLAVSENLSATDQFTMLDTLFFRVSDLVGMAENIETGESDLGLTVADSLALTEYQSLDVTAPTPIPITYGGAMPEKPTLPSGISIRVSDELTLSESIQFSLKIKLIYLSDGRVMMGAIKLKRLVVLPDGSLAYKVGGIYYVL